MREACTRIQEDTMSMIFYIKMDFTRKARLVAGGHLTDPPSCLIYSSVVSRKSVRIAFLITAINGYDVIAADVQNSYVRATSLQKYYAIDGDEFGEDKGLKSSGASWRAHIAHTLLDMGFIPSCGDPDVWMRQAFNQMTKASYWEYIQVYVDDFLAIGMEPRATLNILESDYNYVLKDFGPPTQYLVASIGTYDLNDHTKCFFISPDLVTRRSTTGFLIYLCVKPVVWCSKRHNTVESSTFGSEFVALRIATEKVEALRTKLRQFGVPIDGPCNTFVDNKSVVTQSTKPESTLTKKQNSIAYHKVRESVAMGVQCLCFEKGCDNQADCLTKSLPAYKVKQWMSKCLY
jgi:hypothetical protein